MSYFDSIGDRPLTEREQLAKESNDYFDALGVLRVNARYEGLIDSLESEVGFILTNWDTHAFINQLDDLKYGWLAEFKVALAPLTERGRALGQKNRKRATMTRKLAFKYLAYAKKWLGYEMPANLSKLNKEALSAKVRECFPDNLPTLVDVTYKGVLAILRGLREQGHSVTLRAKLPQLLGQVRSLVPEWESNYYTLVKAVELYQETLESAKTTLTSAFQAVLPTLHKVEKSVQESTVSTTYYGKPEPLEWVA